MEETTAHDASAVQQWLRQAPMPKTPASMSTRRVLAVIAAVSFVAALIAFVITMLQPEPDEAKYKRADAVVLQATQQDTGQCTMVVQLDGHTTRHATSDFGCPRVGSYTSVTVTQSAAIRLTGRILASSINALLAFLPTAAILGIVAQLVAWGRRRRPLR